MRLCCAGNAGEVFVSRKGYYYAFDVPKFAVQPDCCLHAWHLATGNSRHATSYSQIISWCSNWEKRWKYRHIPGPAYSFPLGNLATVRKKMQFRAYTDWQAQYGDTFKTFFVRQPVVVTTDPALARQITVKDFSNFHDRFIPNLDNSLHSGFRRESEQSGMGVARGAYWGSLRAGAQPMFHNDNLKEYAGIINQAVDDLINNLRAAAKTGEQVDMHGQLGRLTMQIIGAAAFGVKFDTQNAAAGDDIPLVTATKVFWANSKPTFWKLCAFVAPPVVMPLLRVLACAFPSQVSADLEDALATLYDASDCLIKNTKKKYYGDSKEPAPWKWFKSNPSNPYKDTVPAESSIISKLLEANNKATGTNFTHMQIASQTNLMMLAGYETTANTLAFCIYLLAKHPHAQQQLLQEVDGFKLGGFYIPKGTPVSINVWAMQRDERYWQEAQAFKPERWLSSKTGGDRTGGMAYMPFGLGPRMCIGIKLALEEAIIALVRLYQTYTFKLSGELLQHALEVKQTITISPKNGVPVTVVQRK
ncbi:TPA: hypothetical protein ACH3X2_012787 [Trebouxia sp. C0005]